MKKTSTYTLGEIETILVQMSDGAASHAVEVLYGYLTQWEMEARAYQVRKELDDIKTPQPQRISARDLHRMEREIPCVMVDA